MVGVPEGEPEGDPEVEPEVEPDFAAAAASTASAAAAAAAAWALTQRIFSAEMRMKNLFWEPDLVRLETGLEPEPEVELEPERERELEPERAVYGRTWMMRAISVVVVFLLSFWMCGLWVGEIGGGSSGGRCRCSFRCGEDENAPVVGDCGKEQMLRGGRGDLIGNQAQANDRC